MWEPLPYGDSRNSEMKLAIFGGIYNNYLALEAAIADARQRNCDAMYCLGDLGAFGPHPDRVFPLLVDNHVMTMQGNYDNSIGNDLKDCQCGYTDPRDNYFARLSYDYTYAKTSPRWKAWMKALPKEIRLDLDGKRVLMTHGSPRKMNEFLWESTTPTHFLEKLCDDFEADVILATHTGIHWQRELPGGRLFVNVGVLGRPENDGKQNVWYTILQSDRGTVCNQDSSHPEPRNCRTAPEMGMVRSRALQRGRGAVAQHPEVRAEALDYEPHEWKVHGPNARQKGVEDTHDPVDTASPLICVLSPRSGGEEMRKSHGRNGMRSPLPLRGEEANRHPKTRRHLVNATIRAGTTQFPLPLGERVGLRGVTNGIRLRPPRTCLGP